MQEIDQWKKDYGNIEMVRSRAAAFSRRPVKSQQTFASLSTTLVVPQEFKLDAADTSTSVRLNSFGSSFSLLLLLQRIIVHRSRVQSKEVDLGPPKPAPVVKADPADFIVADTVTPAMLQVTLDEVHRLHAHLLRPAHPNFSCE